MKTWLARWLHRVWYESAASGFFLWPLALLYRAVTSIRRGCYQRGLFRVHRLEAPVIVVGNLTAGGTGKTPVVVWLAQELLSLGRKTAVISRGYGGTHDEGVLCVTAGSDPVVCGDEPVLIARQADVPVYVSADRVAAAKAAIVAGADVLISDDGLQHYRLGRDVEFVVVDAERQFGNGRLIPAGPLREPLHRLDSVDAVIWNGVPPASYGADSLAFRLAGAVLISLDGKTSCELSDFRGRTVRAIAAIGNPERFFQTLRDAGLSVSATPLHDHAASEAYDLDSEPGVPVIVTEKDAVKLAGSRSTNTWYLPVSVLMSGSSKQQLLEKLQSVL